MPIPHFVAICEEYCISFCRRGFEELLEKILSFSYFRAHFGIKPQAASRAGSAVAKRPKL